VMNRIPDLRWNVLVDAAAMTDTSAAGFSMCLVTREHVRRHLTDEVRCSRVVRVVFASRGGKRFIMSLSWLGARHPWQRSPTRWDDHEL